MLATAAHCLLKRNTRVYNQMLDSCAPLLISGLWGTLDFVLHTKKDVLKGFLDATDNSFATRSDNCKKKKPLENDEM